MNRKALGLAALAVAFLLLVACGTQAVPSNPIPSPQASPSAAEVPSLAPPTATTLVTAGNPCGLSPIVAPTPAADPGYTRRDPSTGLHMTGKMQLIDPITYRLRVTGAVDHPLELTFEQIRCLPKITASPVLTCPGFFVDEATWAGAPIADVLDLAGVQAGAKFVDFVGADGYTASLPLENALDRASFLAYEWEGQPLPRLHGFPLRVVIPGAQGNRWVKWLIEIKVR